MGSISISLGAGQGGSTIVDTLARAGLLHQALYTYPELCVTNFSGLDKSERVIRSFGYVQHAVWAAWRRVPYYRNFETPRQYLFSLADTIFERYLEECDVFIGWSQLSLSCMRKAKDFGAEVILEHQMASVWKWTELVSDEYKRWGDGRQGFYSLFSDYQIARMEAEYHEADKIHVLSDYAQRSFVDYGINPAKLTVVPFGVDTATFVPGADKGGDGKFRILYVGRLELLKGIPYLLTALKRLPKKNVELHLVGPILSEINSILDMMADDRIRVVGPVDRDKLVEIYQNADVFVFPSVNDAFGLVVLEAMACGLPVITTENSCGPDIIEDGVNGFVVPIRNPDAIAERLEELYGSSELRRNIGAAARSTVSDRYTLPQYKLRLVEAYGLAAND